MKVDYKNKKVDRLEKDHQQELTDKLIQTMEESKNLGWEKPWFTCNQLPFNPETGTQYKGINVISLMTAQFEDPRFLTYNNVRDIAAREGKEMFVKKGAKGIPVFKAVSFTIGPDGKALKNEPESTELKNDSRTIYKYAVAGYVFNASQIEGIEPLTGKRTAVEPNLAVQELSMALQKKTGLQVVHSEEGRAYYQPATHKVHMPLAERFKTPEDYADTLFHEFGHSTGPALNRDLSGGKGSASYAKEELVAELSSVFMAAELGIPHNQKTHENHAAYLDSWLSALKSDKTLIFKAASQASKACEFQMTHLKEYRSELLAEKLLEVKQTQEPKKELALSM